MSNKGRLNEVGKDATINNEPSKVQQSKKRDSDINYIMKRYEKTGVVPVTKAKPIFADLTKLGDYHEMLNNAISIKQAFQALPADFRKRVDNDPQKAIDFIENPENILEAVQLGILPKSIVPKLVDDPGNPGFEKYVDKDGNTVDALPGMKSISEINAETAARKAK